MRSNVVVAIIDPELQNDLVAGLHGRNLGHLARVLRQDRGDLIAQITRAGVDTSNVPDSLDRADRVLLVNAAGRSAEVAWFLLQRGATTVWIVNPDAHWTEVDDMPVEIAATPELPPRAVTPAYRSGRTFRPSKHRRRSRRIPPEASPAPRSPGPGKSSRS